MPISTKHPRVAQKLPFWLPGVRNLLEWLLTAGIFCSFIPLIYYRGGSVAMPEAIAVNSIILSIICILFGIWWLAHPSPRIGTFAGFVLLPWMTYLALAAFMREGGQIPAFINLGMWMQATILMTIIATVGRSRSFIYNFLVTLFFFALICAFTGICQYGLHPGWAPGGLAQLSWAQGVACGPFFKPSALATLMLVVLPISYSIASACAFGIEAKIICWVLTFIFASCLILTACIPAIAIMAIMFVIIPLMVSRNIKKNILDWSIAILMLGAAIVLLGATDHESRTRIAGIFAKSDPAPADFMNKTAGSAFANHFIAGVGTSDLSLQMQGVLPLSDNPDTANYNGQYIQSLAACGLAALLLFAPIFWALYLGWKKWTALPYIKISQEDAFRSQPQNTGGKEDAGKEALTEHHHHHHSHHHSSRDESRPMPTTKVLIGGFTTGLTGFCVMMLFSSPLQNEALVFTLATMIAVIAVLAQSGHNSASHAFSGLTGLGTACIWAGLTISVSLTAALSQSYLNDAINKMEAMNEHEGSIQHILRTHYDALNDINSALALEAANRDAIALSAKLELELSGYLPSDAEQLRQHAISSLQTIIASDSHNWYYASLMADALGNSGAANADIAYDNLAIIGNRSPYALCLCAEYFSHRDGMENKALSLVDSALEKIPDFKKALEVKSTISLKKNL
jgi:hypothetical protein